MRCSNGLATLANRHVRRRPSAHENVRLRTLGWRSVRPEKRKVGGSTPPLPTHPLPDLGFL
ncbi:hypothetical protein FMEAI12_4320029 [Parafrankia sp. Ea1.12]|nr:hypothetical protein FMEAI12_4320029 [Parafrankia sp. Ea1.12]